MSTETKIAELLEELAGRERDRLSGMAERWCESPIERLFFLAIAMADRSQLPGPRQWRELREWAAKEHGIEGAGSILVCPYSDDNPHKECVVAQALVSLDGNDYRADFAFLADGIRIAVELDGHDFHERSKEQAKRDKSRDRAFTRAGWSILRFTGSEVHADAESCVDEAFGILFAHRRARGNR